MSNVDQTFLCITFADDTVGIMGFVTAEYQPASRWARVLSRLTGNPVDRVVRWSRPATPENISAEIARTGFDAHKVPVKGWRYIEPSWVPEDRTYRNALRWDDCFTYDMAHARNLHRDYLRRARDRALLGLDVAYFKAVESGDEAKRQRVAVEKQFLRDLPQHPDIEHAGTVEELKAVWPLELVLAEIDLEIPTLTQLLA
jgi:hypothetical protein